MKLNKIVNHEDKVILTKESYNSTSVSVTGLTSTGTSLQALFLQYLYKTVVTILCLRDLYKGISTTIHLLLSLITSLRCKVLQLSLHASLQNKLLQSSLLMSLQDNDLQSYLLVSLSSGFTQSSLLTSLRSKFVLTSPLVYLWKIFLQHLYKDIPTITRIHSKSEMFLQYIWGFMRVTKQVKSETPKA